MASHKTKSFRDLYGGLNSTVRGLYDYAYSQYKRSPTLVHFELKGYLRSSQPGIPSRPIYGARIDGNWRALATMKDGDVYWYWLGIHTDYDRILRGLSQKKSD